ncbi:hypothetical protein [Muribaculum intestinale]|uniref:hypothetical protein n=1 Tax=Muribaculum intestinale TaxID=1796646 RepID=UPI0025A5229B|nr:hypothetical protein [Muribaculum intestinale]
MQTLFDEQGMLNIADIVAANPSYKAIMEDGVVTDKELKDQAAATIAAIRKLQTMCTVEQQNAILEAITEMGVLFAVYHHHELQDLCK